MEPSFSKEVQQNAKTDMEKSQRIKFYVIGASLLIVTVILLCTGITTPKNTSRRHQRQLSSHTPPQDIDMSTIKSPGDMWRRPSENPRWHPVPLNNCCANPRAFQGTEHKSSKFLISKCSAEDEIVRYYGPGTGGTPDDLRAALEATDGDLVIIGDSLSRQWFETLACYLGAFESSWDGFTRGTPTVSQHWSGFEADVTESFFRFRPNWRQRGDLGTISQNGHKLYSSFGYFDLGGKRIIVHQIYKFQIDEMMDILEYYDSRYPVDFQRSRPVMVINKGLHYNWYPTGHQLGLIFPMAKEELRNDLGVIVRYCRDAGSRCILRETSPQHFINEAGDGLWHKNKGARCLNKAPESFDVLSNWRNEVLHDVVEDVMGGPNYDNNDGGFVRVMPLFHALSGLFNHHAKRTDCSHFKMNPELWEPWHLGLLRSLGGSVSRDALLEGIKS